MRLVGIVTVDLFSVSTFRIDGMHHEAAGTRDAASQFHPQNVAIHTPALNAVVVAVDEDVEHSVITKPTLRDRVRSAKTFGAIVASGLIFGSLVILDLHARTVSRSIAERAAATHGEDAPWTPPVGGKPWEPKPYAPIFGPSAMTATLAPGAPLPAATFYVPPVLTAAPVAAPAPIAPSAANAGRKKSKTQKKHAT